MISRDYTIKWWSVYWRMKIRFSIKTIQRVAVIKRIFLNLNLISLLDSILYYIIFLIHLINNVQFVI